MGLVDSIDVENCRWLSLICTDDVTARAREVDRNVEVSMAFPRSKAEVLTGLSGQFSLLQ
jgi:hypothetical protein